MAYESTEQGEVVNLPPLRRLHMPESSQIKKALIERGRVAMASLADEPKITIISKDEFKHTKTGDIKTFFKIECLNLVDDIDCDEFYHFRDIQKACDVAYQINRFDSSGLTASHFDVNSILEAMDDDYVDIYLDGYEARCNLLAIATNPHRAGSDKFRSWEKGFWKSHNVITDC